MGMHEGPVALHPALLLDHRRKPHRAFRIGQKSNVQVHKFVCVGTLEERIDEMIERKKGIVKEVIGSGEQWITELSNEELKSVFALSGEAVEEG